MTNSPYKHRFLLISSQPTDPLDAAADVILSQCNCGQALINVPVFGDVCAVEMPMYVGAEFELQNVSYIMHSAAIVAVGIFDPVQRANKLFQNGADLLVCEIQKWSEPNSSQTIIYLNKDMPNTSSIPEVNDRLIQERLKTFGSNYGARTLRGFCEADFPIHASLHLQRMLAIDPRV